MNPRLIKAAGKNSLASPANPHGEGATGEGENRSFSVRTVLQDIAPQVLLQYFQYLVKSPRLWTFYPAAQQTHPSQTPKAFRHRVFFFPKRGGVA